MVKRRGGCCTILHLREENARFLLLAVVLLIYMVFGATVFHYLERDEEEAQRKKYRVAYSNFVAKYNKTVNLADLEELLFEYGNATATGLVGKRPRWDFSGSFYFVGTVVSTIGFGMSTPKTVPGRFMVIAYGFLGCSGGILFFNLFLERIITLLAVVMRYYHERELRKNSVNVRRDSTASLDDGLEEWKPSVYWVMLCLFLATVTVAASASVLYSKMENWAYSDSIYFCFVAFSTIGFGDFVPSQRREYDNLVLYRLANFCCIVIGCCCIYSLFNVTSIVIKQFLNWLIKKLDFKCSCFKKKQSPVLTQVARARRNALTPNHLKSYTAQHQRSVSVKASIADAHSDPDSNYDSDGEREICMKDFLKSNKVSLAILQKELYESAQRSKYRSPAILLPSRVLENKDDFKTGAVGPLAIVNKALGDDET